MLPGGSSHLLPRQGHQQIGKEFGSDGTEEPYQLLQSSMRLLRLRAQAEAAVVELLREKVFFTL